MHTEMSCDDMRKREREREGEKEREREILSFTGIN